MSIGIQDRKVPNTGINPQINTMSERVIINGKVQPSKILIRMSPILVRMAFTKAIIDWALNMSPNPAHTFRAMIAHSS
jgi:hypothetical protein